MKEVAANCLAMGKALYQGHAVAAVAATSPEIAAEALDLIEVTYEVLPHVIDVEEAMAANAPVLHDDLFTKGVTPKPAKASNVARQDVMGRGDVEAAFAAAEVIVEGRYDNRGSASGLYRAACLRGVVGRRWAEHDLVLEPGAVPCARSGGEDPQHAAVGHQGDPGGNRRRVRRQDDGVSGARGAGAVAQVRTASEDRDVARGSVSGERADVRRP